MGNAFLIIYLMLFAIATLISGNKKMLLFESEKSNQECKVNFKQRFLF